MLRKGEIAGRIYEYLERHAAHAEVLDARIGLGYVAIRLEGNRTGLSAVLTRELPGNCESFKKPGRLRGSRSADLLKSLVDGKTPLEKAVGLATANALIEVSPPFDRRDSLEIMALEKHDRVAMVGFFPPLVQKIQGKGVWLTVIERNPQKAVLLEETERRSVLQECSVAVVTATSILNDTIEDVLNDLGSPRHVALLGPSTPMIRTVFESTKVNHLGGALAADADAILQVVSEGGGTPAMRPYLNFVNILWNGK